MCFYNKNVPTNIYTPSWNKTQKYEITFDGTEISSNLNYVRFLVKKPNKDFVILNLSDIQIRLPEIKQDADCLRRADKTIKKLIKKVQPDLITLTGDQGFGDIREVVTIGKMVDKHGIPWAPVFGNADNRCDGGLSTKQQAFIYENFFDNCIFKGGPDIASLEDGQLRYGNYIINIVTEDNSHLGFHVVKSLIFMNSGDEEKIVERENEKRINNDNYSSLTENQIKWYEWAVESVQKYGKNNNVNCNLFLHIPIYEYNVAYKNANKSDFGLYEINDNTKNIFIKDIAFSYDKNNWNESYKDSFGVRREFIGSHPYSDNVFEAIQNHLSNIDNLPLTDLVIAGHDHRNNFVIKHKNVTLAYALKTANGCYYDKDLTGGSVIKISDNGKSQIKHEYCPVHVFRPPWWCYPIAFIVVIAIILGIIL